MARKKKFKNNAGVQVLIGIVALVAIAFLGNLHDTNLLDSLSEVVQTDSLESVDNSNNTSTVTNVDGDLIIDYIDVGQADSILIRIDIRIDSYTSR